jgi:hypothetical protein
VSVFVVVLCGTRAPPDADHTLTRLLGSVNLASVAPALLCEERIAPGELSREKAPCVSTLGFAEEAEADTGELSSNRPLGAESRTDRGRGTLLPPQFRAKDETQRQLTSEEVARQIHVAWVFDLESC